VYSLRTPLQLVFIRDGLLDSTVGPYRRPSPRSETHFFEGLPPASRNSKKQTPPLFFGVQQVLARVESVSLSVPERCSTLSVPVPVETTIPTRPRYMQVNTTCLSHFEEKKLRYQQTQYGMHLTVFKILKKEACRFSSQSVSNSFFRLLLLVRF
jgi:hypothetical protein